MTRPSETRNAARLYVEWFLSVANPSPSDMVSAWESCKLRAEEHSILMALPYRKP